MSFLSLFRKISPLPNTNKDPHIQVFEGKAELILPSASIAKRGMWVRITHPQLGPWTGIIIALHKDDGTVSVQLVDPKYGRNLESPDIETVMRFPINQVRRAKLSELPEERVQKNDASVKKALSLGYR
jgi:hypothetical protein